VRILVADDDRVLSHLLCSLLRARGWDALPAFDAMQALMFAMRVPHPDAIVLDISMPAGTGLQTLKKLKASSKTAHIPVVVLSGSTDPGAPAGVKELGAAEFLPKPMNPELLIATLSELLTPARTN
jgi:DNA-binding response OmpR family regulator